MASNPSTPYVPASKPRSADIILYLDLDGVVHHEAVLWDPRNGISMSSVLAPDRTLFEWVNSLDEALAPYPDVALVLSSTWCIRPGYAKTLKRLPASLRSRFIGGTFHRRVHGLDPWNLADFRGTARGLQIWADVQRRKPRMWLALDDDLDGWPEWARDNLVACDGTKGLSDAAVRMELGAKLRRCHAALGDSSRQTLLAGPAGMSSLVISCHGLFPRDRSLRLNQRTYLISVNWRVQVG